MNISHLITILNDPATPAQFQDIPLRLLMDASGAYHANAGRECEESVALRGGLYSRTPLSSTTLLERPASVLRAGFCLVCARDGQCLEAVLPQAAGYYSRRVITAWIAGRSWLAKPSRCSKETILKRTRQMAEALRYAAFSSGPAPGWYEEMAAEVRSMIPRLAGRLGDRDSALADARQVIAAGVGGDASLLSELDMIVDIGHTRPEGAIAEALRLNCSLRSDPGIEVLRLPMWAVTYLLRQRGTFVRDLTPVDVDDAVLEAAVALYEPDAAGPHALLSSSIETARACLAV